MEEKVSLYCKNESSDKVYHMQLVSEAAGFMVYAQNGPRGGTLTPRKKTKAPVPYEVAKKEYDSTLKSKLREGYSTGKEGSAFVGSADEQRFTGILPQLLNVITEEEAQELLNDPAWCMQQKYDGHHRLVRRDATGLTSINRKGLVTSSPEEVVQPLLNLDVPGSFTLDGELVGSLFMIFDVLEFDSKDVRPLRYEDRLELMEKIKDALSKQDSRGYVMVTLTARTPAEKTAWYEALRAEKQEGAVFKRLDAPHQVGRPNSGGPQLKRVFVHRASFLVTAQHATKRSIKLGVFDAQGALVQVGNCTVPGVQDIPAEGSIVDVEYLYAFPGGSVFQPRLKMVRDDISKDACLMSQLVYKHGSTDENDDA